MFCIVDGGGGTQKLGYVLQTRIDIGIVEM